jgi:transposase
MTSEANLKWLKETGRRYVLGTPRNELKKWKTELLDENGWQEARDGVQVKLLRGTDGEESFVLCRSADRANKEKAIHKRFADHIKAGLEPLERRLKNSRRKLAKGPIERQIGRLLGKNSRAAGRYCIEIEEDPTVASGLRLNWSIRDGWEEWAQISEGSYVLRSNVTEWTGETLWQTYTQLTQAEAAFRIHKSDLSLRPVWHQKTERVKAHILVCFLAYALFKTLEKWQQLAHLGNSPRLILEELKRIRSTDVVLPTAADPKTELRIRCVVRPDPAQATLLDHLGLRLPERLKIKQLSS